MNELQPQAANQTASSEIGPILFATLVAPLGALYVNLLIGFSHGSDIGLEWTVAHPAIQMLIASIVVGWRDPKWVALIACAITWLGVVPMLMLLRVKGWLNFPAALSAGAVLPLSTVSTFALLFWHSTSATTSEKFIVYELLVEMTVPAAVAAAAAFWGVYEWMRCRAASVPRETDPSIP